MNTITPITALLLLAVPGLAAAQADSQFDRVPSPEGALVYFLSPQDGARVSSPVTVRFGLRAMGVTPAGVQFPNSGHHHLLVDVETPPPDDQPLPATENILHFGLGQTETELSLAPGRHTLQLVLGDHLHRAHLPAVKSAPVMITVNGP